MQLTGKVQRGIHMLGVGVDLNINSSRFVLMHGRAKYTKPGVGALIPLCRLSLVRGFDMYQVRFIKGLE